MRTRSAPNLKALTNNVNHAKKLTYEARYTSVSLLGIKVNSSSATFAGQPSTHLSVSVHGKGGRYCVTKQGIGSYSGSSSGYFALTKYSSNPPGQFSLPAGATTVTVPGAIP